MLFPFPLVAKNYSHFHGNPMGMGIPIPMHTSTLHMCSFHWPVITVTAGGRIVCRKGGV